MQRIEPSLRAVRSRDILLKLISLPSALKLLRAKDKPYGEVIDLLLALQRDEPLPQMKDLQANLGVSPGKARSLLDALYGDVMFLLRLDPEAVPFTKAEQFLHITDVFTMETVTLACRLPQLPQVGERLHWTFFRTELSLNFGYVYRIEHSLEDGKQETWLYARTGFYNHYAEQLLDRAQFEGTLTHKQIVEMPHHLVEKLLREMYR